MMMMTMTTTPLTHATTDTLISEGRRHVTASAFVDTREGHRRVTPLTDLRDVQLTTHHTVATTIMILALRFDHGVETFRLSDGADVEALMAGIYRAATPDPTAIDAAAA